MKKLLIFLIAIMAASCATQKQGIVRIGSRSPGAALDTVNIGTSPNSGTGDPLRTAFIKTNRAIKKVNALEPDSIVMMGLTDEAYVRSGDDTVLIRIPHKYREELGDIVSLNTVKSYGAVGDGVTDDLTAIQDAIAAARAAGGGEVKFPAGTYGISNSIELGSNIVLMGEGSETTEIIASTTFPATHVGMIVSDGDIQDVRIEKLKIDGKNTGRVPKNRNIIISSYNAASDSYNTIKNLTVKDCELTGSSDQGVWIAGGSNGWLFENCYFHNLGDTMNAAGIYTSVEGRMDLTINNCRIDSSKQHGAYIGSGSGVKITNSFFRWNGYGAVNDSTSKGISMRADSNIVITGNHLMYNSAEGLTINSNRDNFSEAVKNIVVTGNVITHNKGQSNYTDQRQVLIHGVNGLNFSNNNVGYGTGTYEVNSGIRMYGENKDILIENNNFLDVKYGVYVATTDSLYNIDIVNNTINATTYGVRVLSVTSGDKMTIAGNRIYGATYGIRIESAFPTNLTIKNNIMKGVTTELLNSGTITSHNIEYKGSSAFTTTATRKALFVDGMNTDYDVAVTPIAVDYLTRPVVDDFTVGFSKADSVIFMRAAGTTSGLKFKYIINND